MSYSVTKYNSLKKQGLAGDKEFLVEHKYGRNDGIPNGSWEPITQTGALFFITTPTTVRVKVTGDAADTTYNGTYTLAANVSDADTVTIGSKVYTWQTTLTDVDGNVKIGASASGSIDNLIAAINLAAGAGSTYAASMTANDDDTSAIAGAGDTMTLFDNDGGAIATTEAGANSSWGAANTVTGAGAQEVTVTGLDQTGALVSEAIATRGALVSDVTTTTFSRLFRAEVSRAGTPATTGAGANTAAIDFEIGAGSQDLLLITAGEGQSQYGCYTIPLGYTGYLKALVVSVDGSNDAAIRCFTRESILDVTAPVKSKKIKLSFDGITGALNLHPDLPILELPALTDIWFEANGRGAGTTVAIDFEIELFK